MTIQTMTEHVAGPPSSTAEPSPISNSAFARYGLTTLDVLLCCAALLTMCAYAPFLHTWFWAPRMAVVLAVVLPGVTGLGLLVAKGDRAARVAAGLLGWALVAAVLSDNWWLSFRGTIVQSTFVLSYLAAFGVWALAQSMTRSGRQLMMCTVLVGVGLNALAGAIQMLFQLEGGNLGLSGGRAVGLTPNPIELASFMLIGIFVCLQLYSRHSTRVATIILAGLFLCGAVLALSATRVALFSFALVSVGALALRRDRRQLVGIAAATSGVVAGGVIARLLGDSTSDALARAGATGSGRADLWVAAWHGLMDRPLVGWGAGRFRSAIQGELPFNFVSGTQDSQATPDAHNIFVNMAIDFGIVGLLLFLVFGWMMARRASGVYSLALIAVPIVWLLQPVAQTTMLVYMLVLGIAVSTGRSSNLSDPFGLDMTVVKGWMWATASIVGVCAASWLLVAEYRLAQASLDIDGEAFASVEWMYFGDPLVSDVGARIWAGQSILDATAEARILPQLERSADLEPSRAYYQARVAAELARLGAYDAAELRARGALDLQPTSLLAWVTLMHVAEQTDDDGLRAEASVALCALDVGSCDAAASD